MKLVDFQNERTMNFGFIHSRYDLTKYGEYVWLIVQEEIEKYLIVDQDHTIIRIVNKSQ